MKSDLTICEFSSGSHLSHGIVLEGMDNMW
jgi:hypothetical protein